MPSLPPIEFIGVPFDWGASRRGCRLGPDACRALGIVESIRGLGREIRDGGNVQLPPAGGANGDPATLHHLQQVLAVCEALAERVENALMQERMPLVMGGDHSIAMGSIGGAARVVAPLGLIWVDAHGDFNSSTTSPSGNIHGMPLAAVLGQADAVLNDIAAVNPKVAPGQTVLIGVRDVDPAELQPLRDSGMTIYTAWDLTTRGIAPIIAEALAIVSEGTAGIHLSFDLDSLEPGELPGTGTLAPGGMTFREASVLVQAVAASGQMRSLEITELNPLLDQAGISCKIAKELALIACGKVLA